MVLPLASPVGCPPFTVFDSMVGIGGTHSNTTAEKDIAVKMEFSVKVDGVEVWKSPEFKDITDTHRVRVSP